MKTTERQKESLKKYYLKNKEKLNDLAKLNYLNNKESKRIVRDEYVKNNPDKIILAQKKWYLKNKEIKLKKSKEYIKNNPLKHRIYGQKRRYYKKKTCDKSINENSILQMMSFQNNNCVYCNADISDNFHLDHMIPLIKGGVHKIENIQLLCPTCNLSKNKKTNLEYIEFRKLTLKK